MTQEIRLSVNSEKLPATVLRLEKLLENIDSDSRINAFTLPSKQKALVRIQFNSDKQYTDFTSELYKNSIAYSSTSFK